MIPMTLADTIALGKIILARDWPSSNRTGPGLCEARRRRRAVYEAARFPHGGRDRRQVGWHLSLTAVLTGGGLTT